MFIKIELVPLDTFNCLFPSFLSSQMVWMFLTPLRIGTFCTSLYPWHRVIHPLNDTGRFQVVAWMKIIMGWDASANAVI